MTTAPQPNVALEAERAVLGGLLINCGEWPPDVELLSPGHFSCPVRARVFRAMVELHDTHEPVDTLTVLGALKDVSKPPHDGWAIYLAELADSAGIAANIDHHAGLVLREARRRDYVETMASAVDKARTPGADADEIATEAALQLGRIADGRQLVRPMLMRDILKAEFADLDERRRSEAPVGQPTGFPELDALVCGLVPGHLVVIAGRPSMGKSSLARSVLTNMAARGIGSLLFSFEMGADEIGQASIAAESRVNLQKIREARLTELEYNQVVEGMARLHNSKLAIVDRPGMSIAEIRTVARAHAGRHPIAAVAVDYLQLAVGRGQTREQEIASISRGLKALAKELRVTVIALSQLNRGLEARKDDKRPKLSDLRESGAIEQDADEVILLYRDEYYNPGTKEPGIAEIGVAKSRNGPTGMVKLRWVGKFTRFESMKTQSDFPFESAA